MKSFLSVLTVFALLACIPPDPAFVNGTGCPGACDRIRVCKLERSTSPKNVPCENVCENAENNGVDFGTKCLIAANTCDVAKACP